ncbi:class I SAM-dependent methyltransferase [Alphaproteobacteria bacterium]|nr:class I SAM-dependent methyltransferase [Alphaproteobacteria bacterium]
MVLREIHTKREDCRLCNSSSLAKVLDLAPIPLSENYFLEQAKSKAAKRFPIDLYMCESCGHVQHIDVIDPAVLWDGYTYFSADSSGMVDHFNDVANFLIERIDPKKGSLVVDIGSNDGSFLRCFKDRGFEVCGVDPADQAAKRANDNGIRTFVDLFNCCSAKHVLSHFGKASIVTAFNVFAHADDLSEMIEAVKSLLNEDGVFVFEAQYLSDIVNKNLIATIFHEHISHHSVIPLKCFFDRLDMELIFLKHDDRVQHGSIIGAAQIKGQRRIVDKSVSEFVTFERRMELNKPKKIHDFGRTLKRQKLAVGEFVQKERLKGKTFAGFGAARSAPTLIAQFGLADCIDFIVDDSTAKLNCYSPGDGILVKSIDCLYEDSPDYTFILAWVHAFKIIEKHKKYLRNGGAFVLLSPNTKLVNETGEFDL